jgi:hypothetical protein
MIDVNSRRKASGIQHRARFGFYFEELVGIDIDYFDTTKQILRTILTEEDPMTTKKSGAKRSSRKYSKSAGKSVETEMKAKKKGKLPTVGDRLRISF